MPSSRAQAKTAQGNNQDDEKLRRSISAELERISVASITALNDRDWNFTSAGSAEYCASVAPAFKCVVSDSCSDYLSFDQLWRHLRERCEDCPRYRVKVITVSSDVDLKFGEGTVHMVLESQGLTKDEGVVIHGGNEFTWKLQTARGTREPKWMILRVFTMRACIGDEGLRR